MADLAFGAVWRPGTGTQWVRWGMTGDEFKAQDTTYFQQGLRIQNFAIRAEWEMYDVSDDLSTLSAGLIFRF